MSARITKCPQRTDIRDATTKCFHQTDLSCCGESDAEQDEFVDIVLLEKLGREQIHRQTKYCQTENTSKRDSHVTNIVLLDPLGREQTHNQSKYCQTENSQESDSSAINTFMFMSSTICIIGIVVLAAITALELHSSRFK